MDDHTPHIEWMLTQGRFQTMQGLVDGLGARLRAGGIPVMRMRLGIRTTHPLTAAFSVMWEADGNRIAPNLAQHGLETRSAYIGSPMAHISETRTPFRRKLTGPLNETDHLFLHEMQDRGATDYYGLPLEFSMGTGGILTLVSDGPDGFSADQITTIDQIASVLAPVVEPYERHHLATSIATSYLGARTGQRVLDGQITRGDIETIEAAILISDIRGWTRINATRPPSEALELANRYFEVISDAVDRNEGEILKFLGDGVLALFPSDGTAAGRDRACRNAMTAAQAAHDIAAQSGLDAAFGIGIHFGEVLYGNIGARARIDFTVLGQAVNIAARIEALTATLGHAVLVSDTVAGTMVGQMTHVGTEPLKGLEAPMPVYSPAKS
ncbi:adenylate/guanylate cyclase domain-containing protein [uncultured Tateyamaria sp.]|uniref:adenylate/guanylate cyclase domain-containing protein n=1 Tax=uncultured Tateyamaria sp. TaxID=455651 RepID=UPI00261C0E8C|nr:adenylate/guanylate cyclase domain-containing protein [uncultured Tateyamaria sp.]